MLTTIGEAHPIPALCIDIAAAQQGDHQAFARLVDAARTTVASIALATVRDISRSEEVAQEVLVAAWQGLPGLRDPESFWPWLRQLTRNRARQHLRGWARKRRWFGRAGDDALAAAIDPGKGAEAQLVEREEQAALAAALEELPDETRELVVLFYREGQSIAQVAALLGITEATARKRLQRARDQVRTGVLQQLGELASRSAPGAVFTAAVMAAITAAVPSTAAAAGLGVGAKLASGLKLSAALASLPGLLAGAVGILLPLRKLIRNAHDQLERRQLRQLTAAAIVGLVVFTIGMNLTLVRRDSIYMIVGYAYMQLSFIVLYGFCMPRIARRREAVEIAADPSAGRRHRRSRFWSLFGLVVGAVCGSTAVWYAAMFQR
jgi:RNA polymerase sigma factor (sigma-70 family)